ncbi:uncharacterized protein LOC133309373 [Gastrolobium bilobum]|uniref:uncharacterized protein LOC133309373 n=1 Tax=Gastrolobium bilobum TaxID=150636 RepID=UPI002AB133C5|nr:uncharacterized protein LOC133309373 [Gastrolobium bilobum]XP_061366119.1 uncharacterized protein LOC133309373 [Gastrolobium bilobum]
MEGGAEMPLLLGRPFLATARALIDVENGKLELRMNEETVTINVFDSLKQSSHKDDCFSLEVKEKQSVADDAKEDGAIKVDLKELPQPQKNVFLGDKEAVIEALKEEETELKNKDPFSHTNKILNEDDDKPGRKSKRRRHPMLKKVLRKEVVKLVDTSWKRHRELKFDKRHRDSISRKNQSFKEFLAWINILEQIWELWSHTPRHPAPPDPPFAESSHAAEGDDMEG